MLTGNLSELFRGIRLFDRVVISTSSSSSRSLSLSHLSLKCISIVFLFLFLVSSSFVSLSSPLDSLLVVHVWNFEEKKKLIF